MFHLVWMSPLIVSSSLSTPACANLRCEHHRQVQSSSATLSPFEVNFAYEEPSDEPGGGSMTKNALVKVVLCHRCSRKLKYKSDRERARQSASPVRKQSKK